MAKCPKCGSDNVEWYIHKSEEMVIKCYDCDNLEYKYIDGPETLFPNWYPKCPKCGSDNVEWYIHKSEEMVIKCYDCDNLEYKYIDGPETLFPNWYPEDDEE